MDLRKIGKFIAKKRTEKGFTQESLAEELGISNRAISKWERGICLPDAENMAKLCQVLGITYNELLNGENLKEQNAPAVAEQTVIHLVSYADQRIGRLRRIAAGILIFLGIAVIVAAASVFQSGTHASMYGSVFGVLILLIGASFLMRKMPYWQRLLAYLGVFVLSMAMLLGFDFLSVKLNHVPPRFTYAIITWNDLIYYDTPFYDVIRCNPDAENESWQIIGNTYYDTEKIAEWGYCAAKN